MTASSCEKKADNSGNATVYESVIIGTQVWMLKNLNVTKYRNGDAIPNITDTTQWCNLTTGAYCNYDNFSTNADTYGRLYNWYAVNDSRNIAPMGWHVATDAEWKTLSNYMGGEGVAGSKLKEAGTNHWSTLNTGTNESGFTALPGGSRWWYDGKFGGIGIIGYWWTSSEYTTTAALCRNIYSSMSFLSNSLYGENKKYGFSVRCVKD